MYRIKLKILYLRLSAVDPETTLSGICQVVPDVVADLPNGFRSRWRRKKCRYFMILVPPDLQRQLVLKASKSGVDLSRLAKP